MTYKITFDPIEKPANKLLPQSVKNQLQELHDLALSNPKKALNPIKTLIQDYPNLPELYNYLHVVYVLLGDEENDLQVLKKTLKLFPDYVFGKIALAEYHLDQNQMDMIPKIFDNKYDLKMLYPERDLFHVSEVLAFNTIMAKYFHEQGDEEKAKQYYKMMDKLDPDDKKTKAIKQLLSPSSIPNILEKLMKLV